MTTRSFLAALTVFGAISANAQNVGINSTGIAPVASAMLDISSTNSGVLIPRIGLASAIDIATIPTPANSLLVYNTATVAGINAVSPGYYYWDNVASRWRRFASDGDAWRITGNAATTATTNFLGTTDDVALRFRTFNSERFEISTGTGGATGTGGRLLAFQNGTATSPLYSWSTSLGMGLFRQADNVLGISTGGIERFRVPNANQVYANADGTAAAPFYSWTTSTGMGLFRQGNNVIGVSTGGMERLRFPNANQVHANALGTSALPFYSWTADPNTGLWSPGADILASSTAGVERMRILADGRVAVNSTVPGANLFSAYGTAANPTAIYGQAAGDWEGVHGTTAGPNGFAIWGRNTNANGTAVVGTMGGLASSYLLAGSGAAFTGSTTGSYHFTTSPGVAQGLLVQDNFTAQWNIGYWDGLAYWKIIGDGFVSTIVRDLEDRRVAMYCPESPEVLFLDYGIGELIDGRAVIVLDPVFTKNILVDSEHPMKVFVQLEGDCNGVYVTNKSSTGFEIRELAGGISNAAFSWSVVATRGDQVYRSADGTERIISAKQRFGAAPPIHERGVRTFRSIAGSE